MSKKEIWKVNGVTFTSEKDASDYCAERYFLVTSKETTTYKGTKVHFWDVTDNPNM
jgi:hypothetical protein